MSSKLLLMLFTFDSQASEYGVIKTSDGPGAGNFLISDGPNAGKILASDGEQSTSYEISGLKNDII